MLRTILLVLLVFLYSISGSSQWTSDTDANTLVADSEGGDMKAIGASDGSTYIVFWKTVAAPTNYELRLQVLNPDGIQQLGDDGMLVSDQIPMSTFTVLWSVTVDANDNLYVGVTGSADESGHAFKLDLEGNNLWGINGVNVGTGYSLKILPLESGEAIVSWFPSGAGLMQKYDIDGNAVWPSAQPISTGTGTTVPAELFELSDGGCVIVYHSVGFGINSTLYAQRFDSAGESQWSSDTQLSDNSTVFNRDYSGTQDGDVVYFGYFASSGNRFDSYVQRVDPDGSIPWGINGTDFVTNETDYEMDTRIAYSTGIEHLWAICTYTNPLQSELGERVQKIDKNTGARLLTDNAQVIFSISEDHRKHASELYLVGDKPFFLSSMGYDNGASPTSLAVVLLDQSGAFFWLEGSLPIATYEDNKSRVDMSRPINEQAVAVFIENKGVGDRIYAQNFMDSELIVGLQEFSSRIQLSSYPNPTEGPLYISLSSTSETKAMLQVYSLTGEIVADQVVFLRVGDNQILFDPMQLDSGIYSFRIFGEDVDAYGKFTLLSR